MIKRNNKFRGSSNSVWFQSHDIWRLLSDFLQTFLLLCVFNSELYLKCTEAVRGRWEKISADTFSTVFSPVFKVLYLKIMCKGKFCVLISFFIIFVVVILISATRGLTWVIMHFTPPCGQNGYYNTKVNPTQKQMFSSGTKNLNYLRLQPPGTN